MMDWIQENQQTAIIIAVVAIIVIVGAVVLISNNNAQNANATATAEAAETADAQATADAEATAAAEETEEAMDEETEEAMDEETEEAMDEETEEAMDEEGEEPFRIAVVMPSTADDLAWSQSLMDSLSDVQEEMGGEEALEIAFSENLWQITDAADAIRKYAEDGYDLVFGHGTQYGTTLFDIAPDFPDVSFAWGTASDTGEDEGIDNIFAYEARAEEGGYINGVIAANITESKVVGVVGPVEAGDALLYIQGFILGVEETDPEVEVLTTYTGSFGDTALAAEAANTQIQAGADVLTGSAQQVPGAIEAIEAAEGYYLATQVDQSVQWPETVVAAQVFDWKMVINDMIEQKKNGVMGGIAYELSLENGGMTMVYNEELDVISDELMETIEETQQKIIDGDIDVQVKIEEIQEEEAEETEETEAEETMSEETEEAEAEETEESTEE